MTGNAGCRGRSVTSAALLFGLLLSAPLQAQTMEGEPVAAATFVTPGAPAVQTQQEKPLEPASVPLPHSDPVAAPFAASGDADPQAKLESSLLVHTAELFASGLASWYGPRFHGRRTANGERYNMHELTAAHKTLPFGTRLRVRSVHTGKEVVVRINDRGPYKHNRIIDLSLAAITALGLRERGVSAVELLRE